MTITDTESVSALTLKAGSLKDFSISRRKVCVYKRDMCMCVYSGSRERSLLNYKEPAKSLQRSWCELHRTHYFGKSAWPLTVRLINGWTYKPWWKISFYCSVEGKNQDLDLGMLLLIIIIIQNLIMGYGSQTSWCLGWEKVIDINQAGC